MFEYILKSRVKYVAVALFSLFCLILFLTGTGDHLDEEKQLGEIQYKKNINQEKADSYRKVRSSSNNVKNSQSNQNDPSDFQVKFISGKEIANEVDNEKKSFQVHRIKLMNMERTKVLIGCQDPFSSFGKAIPPGGSYEFRVTDLFARRHYWCFARYGTAEYTFKAYGEGAPRDNNQISLHKEGAYINGKSMVIEDAPMNFKQRQPAALQDVHNVQQNDNNHNAQNEMETSS